MAGGAAGRCTVLMVSPSPTVSVGQWRELMTQVPAPEHRRIEGLRRPQDRLNSATGWQLLHRLTTSHGTTLQRDADGRPRCTPPADVSLSHSGSWVGVALCPDGRVGIDVETVRDVSPSLSRRALSAQELSWLHQAPPGRSRDQRFFRLWTAKEAFLKATGVGLASDPRSVTIDCSSEEPVLLGHEEAWTFSASSPADGVCATLCVELAP